MDPNPSPATSSTEDNTVAIICYLTIIGFVAAIIIHGNKKTALGTFHLRQALGLILLAICGWFALMIVSVILAFIPYLGHFLIALLWPAFGVGLLVLVVMGVIGAANRKAEPLPVVGAYFQKWFGTAFG